MKMYETEMEKLAHKLCKSNNFVEGMGLVLYPSSNPRLSASPCLVESYPDYSSNQSLSDIF